MLPENVTSKGTPKEPRFLITDEWIAEVDRRLAETGMKRAELARRVGCSAPTITDILGNRAEGRPPKQTHSDRLPRINKVLGIVAEPGNPSRVKSKTEAEWMAAGDRAAAAGRLELMLAWVKLGERYAALDPPLLESVTEKYQLHVEGAEDMEMSRDAEEIAQKKPKSSAPLRIPTTAAEANASDRAGKTVHGSGKTRDR